MILRSLAENQVIKLVCVFTFFTILGCKSTTKINTNKFVESDYIKKFIEYQADRVNRVKFLTGYGVVETLKNKKILQADCEFWFLSPDQVSIRITKLGEVIGWLGHTNKEPWFFEQLNEKMYLRKGSELSEAKGYPPAIFQSLLGLASIQFIGADASLIEGERLSFTPHGLDDKWKVVYFLDPPSYLPFKVEVFQSSKLIIKSVIDTDSYQPVKEKGLSELRSIKIPTFIQVYDEKGTRVIKVKLDFLTTVKDEQPLESVFNLNKLIMFLQPEECTD